MNYKKYIILLLIVITGNWPASADTDESIVFGPVTYERTADSPDIFESEFSNPYSEGNFTLYLQNGRDGNHKISSATIILNGETIVRQNEFNQAVNYINRSIKLKPSNNLKVRLNSKPGGVITLYVKKEHDAPVVEINFPIANAYHPVKVPLDGTPVVLKTVVVGTVKGSVTNATIKVNADTFEVPVIDGGFYQDVTLLGGANQISVYTVDKYGSSGYAGIVAYVENTNEEVILSLPQPSPFENKKLGTGLNYTAYLFETQGIDAAIAYLRINPNDIIESNNIRVRLALTENKATYIDALESSGIDVLEVIDATDTGGEIIVHVFLPVSRIREVGEMQFVKAVYVDSKPSPESITEGDAIIGSDKVRNLGFTGLKPDGSPVEVAVIDSPGDVHEAKVMDVIHSIAPGAKVLNYSGNWTDGIENATRDGVDIISVSQSAPWLDLDGTDELSYKVKLSREHNILYINAAGNYANLHYKGTYTDEDNNGLHEFGHNLYYWDDDTLNVMWSFVLDDSVTAYLHLNQADLDKLDIKAGVCNYRKLEICYLQLFNINSSIEDKTSKGVKSITVPSENFSDVRFVVFNTSKYRSSEVVGTPFHIFVLPNSSKLDKQLRWVDQRVEESSIPAPATSKYTFTVGATNSDLIESTADTVMFLADAMKLYIPQARLVVISAMAAKYKFPTDGLAFFSGQGPVYDDTGKTIIKPDVAAPTFVFTDHGFFGGTSASAPHVAGAAALLLSANPALTADQLQQVLEESAVDLGDPGKDNKYGAGRIDVYEAVKKVTPDLQPSNIQLIQNTATEGLNVTIRADVNNTGYWDAQNVEVQFLENNTVINTSIIPLLKAGNTTTIETKWLAGNYGSYNISVSIDPANRIPEFNESNNHASRIVDLMWLEGWGYRKKLTIKGSTAGAQTNYQMKLNVHAGNGIDTADTVYLNNNIAGNDFRDLRFTKSDGVTLLDYWIENYVDGNSAIVWVEVDSVPSSPESVDVYAYYGNKVASVASNIKATFLIGDDFDDNLMDTNIWIETDNILTIDEINNMLKISGTTTAEHRNNNIKTIKTISKNVLVHVKIRKNSATDYFKSYIIIENDNNNQLGWGMWRWIVTPQEPDALGHWMQFDESSFAENAIDPTDTDTSFHTYEIILNRSDGSNKLYRDSSLVSTKIVKGFVNATVYFKIYGTTRGANQDYGNPTTVDVDYDDFFVRSYSDPEPTWSGT